MESDFNRISMLIVNGSPCLRGQQLTNLLTIQLVSLGNFGRGRLYKFRRDLGSIKGVFGFWNFSFAIFN